MVTARPYRQGIDPVRVKLEDADLADPDLVWQRPDALQFGGVRGGGR